MAKRAKPAAQANGGSHGAARSATTGPYRVLAIDLDGTLLDHRGVPSDEDVAALRRIAARGVKITILTGRLFSGTREAAHLLGIDGPVGCCDGSHIVSVKATKTLLHHGIRGRAAGRL